MMEMFSPRECCRHLLLQWPSDALDLTRRDLQLIGHLHRMALLILNLLCRKCGEKKTLLNMTYSTARHYGPGGIKP